MATLAQTQPTTAEDWIDLEVTRVLGTHRIDTRTIAPDQFVDLSPTDWSSLRWQDLGRPYQVNNYSKHRRNWEAEHAEEMPVKTQWEYFNRFFHEFFITNIPEKRKMLLKQLLKNLGGGDFQHAFETLYEMMTIAIWNKIHRMEDAVWDPRGKRALFEGLDVKKPEILFLGSAEGYEAMQLLAMYPHGHAVLVDYDEFCKTDRYGKFPEAYPFVGVNPSSGQAQVWYREQMNIDFEVEDIRNLNYGREFDIVLSVGLIEHFPDEHKPLAMEMHRRFLKPNGYAIVTTPRVQLRSKMYYKVMGDLLNFGYRELMDARQMGLYVYENGFDILRAGVIKAHNGLIAKERQHA